MGLDAYVPCHCWLDGLTAEPPMSRHLLEYEDRILSVREDAPISDDERIRLGSLLDTWLETCCPHPYLVAYGDWVGNWSMVRTFTGYVELVDQGHLPTLRTLIPAGNAGMVWPSQCARGLIELSTLCNSIGSHQGSFLVKAGTGEEVYYYVPAYQGQLSMGPRFRSGFDPGGLWVQQDGVEVFRAPSVVQRIVSRDATTRVAEWTAPDASRFAGHPGISDEDCEWRVSTRPLVPDDIPCVTALTGLFRASIETGSPVCWC